MLFPIGTYARSPEAEERGADLITCQGDSQGVLLHFYPGIATSFTPTLDPELLIKIRRRDNLAA